MMGSLPRLATRNGRGAELVRAVAGDDGNNFSTDQIYDINRDASSGWRERSHRGRN